MGGITITQDPLEAAFDSMPTSALSQVEIDHCISVHEMPSLLEGIGLEQLNGSAASIDEARQRMGTEVSVAVDGDAFRKGVMDLGRLTPFTCPECEGVWVRITEGKIARFRCHTGHAYSSRALLSGVMEKIDASY
jgi:two-component system chemotaxis response regulator CheB